jgi:hypothetical protein
MNTAPLTHDQLKRIALAAADGASRETLQKVLDEAPPKRLVKYGDTIYLTNCKTLMGIECRVVRVNIRGNLAVVILDASSYSQWSNYADLDGVQREIDLGHYSFTKPAQATPECGTPQRPRG